MWFLIIKTKPQSVPLGQQVFDHPIQGDRLTTQHKTYGAYFLPIPISCIPCPIMNKILFYALKYRYPSYHCSTSNQCDTSNHRSTSNQCDTSNHHCTSNQCDTSNQCSTSKQHGTSNQCSTWNHRSTSNHPSTSNQYSPSNRCQPSNPHTPMMGFSPFEGSQKNIHWWDFPCSESVLPSWESPHSEECVCAHHRWDSPLVSVNADMPTGTLSYPMGVKTLRCEISPTRSPPLCCRDFPTQRPRLMFRWWDFPHLEHKH